MTTFPTLYKLTATGATQEWTIAAFPKDGTGPARIETRYGQVGGVIQTAVVYVREGKNIGRANQTSDHQQAIAEAQSRWNKQKDKGYGESVQAEKPSRKPMLAHDYHKNKKSVVFPAYAQPKLDGIRCLAHIGDEGIKLYSRMGKPIVTMDHIVKELDGLKCGGNCTLDGELYIHGESFQQIISWVKRLQPNSLKVEYHIYDVIDSRPFPQRFRDVYNCIWERGLGHIKPVAYREIVTESELRCLHDIWVEDGYEGAMLRHNGCPYKEGYRSRDLLKYKEFIDEEFEIVGATEGKGGFENMAIFTLKTKDGALFDCMPKGTEEIRREYWENRDSYIGKMMTVRFFEWTSSDPPVPRFPIGIAVREYE